MLVLVAALATAGPVQAKKKKKHKPKPASTLVQKGKTYSGTYAGGTVTFTVAKDGKSIVKGMSFSKVRTTCEGGQTSEWQEPLEFHAMPIKGVSFSFHVEDSGYVYDVKGTFGPRGTAKGTFSVHQPPPPPPPGVDGFVDPMGACDTGKVPFTAKA